ncbi:zinc finger protein 492-like isoform X1 [Hetaerina americana]|uniref:zinc finger protein 492-like isoform X1 n=2 Tax=Hetaerina americana TaxID=62018 RepID=UPI003A7F3CE8
MCDKGEFKLCRLCLNSRGLLMNVFGENSQLQFMLEKTIEDLIDVKVVEDADYPWLVCSNCMEKLTEFRLFKRRCAECLSVFYNRIQEGRNPATKYWITNRHEFPDEINEEFCDDLTVSDAIDNRAVNLPDDMFNVKEEIGTASECSASPVRDIESLMVTSMQEGCSHWSGSEEAGTMDHLQDDKLCFAFTEEMIIKKEWDLDIPQEKGCVGVDLSQEQDGQEHGDAEKKDGLKQDDFGNLLHKCQICNNIFKERELLKAHVRRMHLEKERLFRCDVCSVVFECKSDLHEHVKSLHSVRREYQCQHCFIHFQNMNELQIHLLAHISDRPYKCEICLKAFTEKTILSRHILTHTREKPHKCDVCLKAFSRKGHLKRHIWTHTDEKQLKCKICSKAFTQNGNLRKHMSTHNNRQSYKCKICSKSFNRNGTLKKHMITHTDERSYKCEICSRAFSRKGALKRHMSTHTGEKSFKCEICSKAFNRKEVLQSHMLTHTGQRPYKCKMCSKSFTQYSILKRHIISHTGERSFQCKICSKGFTRKNYLESHSLIHSVERHHRCEICSKAFKHKSNLNQHKKLHAQGTIT